MATAKKRETKGQPKAEKKAPQLATSGSVVTPAMFGALKKTLRTFDADFIINKLKEKQTELGFKKSDPVVRNFLKHGQCTDARLWNAVIAILIERNNEENEAANKLLSSEINTVETLVKIVSSRHSELKEYLDKLLPAK